jgi:hypothetical protein
MALILRDRNRLFFFERFETLFTQKEPADDGRSAVPLRRA